MLVRTAVLMQGAGELAAYRAPGWGEQRSLIHDAVNILQGLLLPWQRPKLGHRHPPSDEW